jgi:glycine/D-amino acid oxidase-like deaminating enzyme
MQLLQIAIIGCGVAGVAAALYMLRHARRRHACLRRLESWQRE